MGDVSDVSNCHSNFVDCPYKEHPHMHTADQVRRNGETHTAYTVRFLPIRKVTDPNGGVGERGG